MAVASPSDIFVNLHGCLHRSGATHVLSTPTLIAQCSPCELSQLEVVGIGGEPPPRKVVDSWLGKRLYASIASLRSNNTHPHTLTLQYIYMYADTDTDSQTYTGTDAQTH